MDVWRARTVWLEGNVAVAERSGMVGIELDDGNRIWFNEWLADLFTGHRAADDDGVRYGRLRITVEVVSAAVAKRTT